MPLNGDNPRPGEPPSWHGERKESRFGRSALLVSLLALAPVLALLLFTFSESAGTTEGLTARGLAAAASVVLMIWSGWLASRAFRRLERDTWPSAALVLLSFEACVVLVAALASL
ncbi:MAG: hypothetical protein M5U26_01945 [Planctomycetota bacterium]|nr:hypothetical protein [Planctomycetota bacterium]